MESRRVLRFVILILLLAAVGVVSAQTGFIQVRASPGIQVFLDDVFVGVTNAEVGGLIVMDVPVGQRRLRFVSEGFLPQDATVSVAEGQVLLYEVGRLVPRVRVREEGEGQAAELQIETGSVVVQCLPLECVVDVPALGITSRRKTQDRLVLEGVPVGSYDGRISAGDVVLPVRFGVCTDDTVSLFATLVGSEPGVRVTSEAGLGPACVRVGLRLVAEAQGVVVGGRLALTVEADGLDPELVQWSASAGSIEGTGSAVVLVAPDAASEVRVRVQSLEHPELVDELSLSIAPYVVERFEVEPKVVAVDGSVVFTWSIAVPPGMSESMIGCVLEVPGVPDIPIDDCREVTSASVTLPSAGAHQARLRLTDDRDYALATAGVTVRRTEMAAGAFHAVVLDTHGRVWAWGRNSYGQLGDGTTIDRHAPVQVTVPEGISFVSLAAGNDHTLAIDANGSAWAWGRNEHGQLGDGTTTDRSQPTRVQMPAGIAFSAVAGGPRHSLALDPAGNAYAWGQNRAPDRDREGGQLGDGTFVNRTTPVQVSMPTDTVFTSIAAGFRQSYALDTSGQAWAWGLNYQGMLGDGTGVGPYWHSEPSPVRVRMPEGVSFTTLAVGREHVLALDSEGRAWVWGRNASGLGDGTRGTSVRRPAPVQVRMPSGVAFTSLAAGYESSFALDTTGQAWAWGYNRYGTLAMGDTNERITPARVRMPNRDAFVDLVVAPGSWALALDTNDGLWGWGRNQYGSVGEGTTQDHSAPVRIAMP